MPNFHNILDMTAIFVKPCIGSIVKDKNTLAL